MGPEGAGETVEDPSSDEERATTDGESEVEEEADDADARQSQTHLMILQKWKSKVQLTSWPP